MGNICLRGVDDSVRQRLKHEAAKIGTSVNALILQYIHKGIGIGPARRSKHHDLDQLAGTWSNADTNEFLSATHDFNKIDEEIWK